MLKQILLVLAAIAIVAFGYSNLTFAQMEAPPITGIACYNWQTGAPEPCDDGGGQQSNNQGNQWGNGQSDGDY